LGNEEEGFVSKLVIDTPLPTTMVGSYPRPRWFDYQLHGADFLHAIKLEEHREAFEDAALAVIREQEDAGLDVVTDGQMFYDDYGGSIGSLCWYWYERIPGFSPVKHHNPLAMGAAAADPRDTAVYENWGGTIAREKVRRGAPSRLVDMFQIARRSATRPVKVSVGAGPVNLGFHVDYAAPDSAYRTQRELAEDLVPIFNAELKELAAAGAQAIQLEDLGAWLVLTEDDPQWIVDVMNGWIEGVDALLSWHFCLGAGYGNPNAAFEGQLMRILEPLYEVRVDQYVLDFAWGDMADVSALRDLPDDKGVAAGVVDIRSLRIESDAEIAERMRRVLEVVPYERVWFTTDCGLKALPRFVAKQKLAALGRAAQAVRAELPAGAFPKAVA
jgi:5-methyltetrahydropteroyltriglutamate--homocysteine methyltransferase